MRLLSFGKICCYVFVNHLRSVRVCRSKKKKNNRRIVLLFNAYLRMCFKFNFVIIFQMFKDSNMRCFAEKQIAELL